ARYDRDVDGPQRTGLSPQVVRRGLRPVVLRHWRLLWRLLCDGRRAVVLQRLLQRLLWRRLRQLLQWSAAWLPAERSVPLLWRLGRKLEAGLWPLWRAPSWLWL